MARTFMRPGQMSGSATFNDGATVGSSMEDNGGLRTLDDDLNNLRSIIKNLAGETNWYDDVTAVGGVQRNHAQLHTHLDGLMSGSRPMAGVTLEGDYTQAGATFNVDATNAITLDGAAASNLTVDGASLTLSTTTSGELDLTSAGLMDMNAGANLDVDVTGTFALDATGTMSLDAVGASNVTTDSGNLTLSTTTSGDVVVQAAAGAVDIDADSGALSLDGSAGINIGTESDVAIDMDSSTLDIDASGAVTLDSTAGVSIDAGAASNFSTSAGALTLDGAGGLNIGTAADTAIDMDADTLDIDASGAVTIDASAAGVSIDAAAASNFSTSAGALTLEGASGASLSASGGDVTVEGTTFSGNDVTIPGDLTVQGTTTTLETTNATVKDSLIALGSSSAGIDTNADRGLLLPRTADVSKAFFWDHSDSTFALVDTWSSGSDTAVVIDAYQDLKVKDITFSGLTENQVAYPDSNGKLEGSANFTFDDSDLQLADNIGLVFSTDDAEKIESDGTDLTVNSGGDINLTATSDVNVPANVGMTFGDDGEKIEGDGTDLTISSSNDLNLTPTNDLSVNASNSIDLQAESVVTVDANGGTIYLGNDENSNVNIKSTGIGSFTADLQLNLVTTGSVGGAIVLSGSGGILIDGVGSMTVGSDNTLTGYALTSQDTWDIDASGAATIDAVGASNFTTDSGNLTLSTTTSGDVVVQAAAGAVDIDADSGALSLDGSAGINIGTESDVAIDMDASSLDIDASSGFALDGAAASNVTATGADLTLSTVTSGDVNVDSAAALYGTGAVGVTMTATAGDATLTAPAGAANISGSTYVNIDTPGSVDMGTFTPLGGVQMIGDTAGSWAVSSFSAASLSSDQSVMFGTNGVGLLDAAGAIAGLNQSVGVLLSSGSSDYTSFLSNFSDGEQTLLGSINAVYDLATGGNISKTVYTASGSIAADTAIEGVELTSAAWLADDINVHLNGVLQRSGSQGEHDAYRDASGNLKFNYALEDGDFIVVQSFGS